MNRYDDEDDDRLFETIIGHDGKPRKIARDGAVIKVPMFAMDSLQRDVREHFADRSLAVTDTRGSQFGLHRPGWRIQTGGSADDQMARDEHAELRQDIYDAYDQEMQNAWRNPANTELVAPSTSQDNMEPIEDAREDAYLDYEEDISNRWRGDKR